MPHTPILSTGLRLVQESLAQLPPDTKAAVVMLAEAKPGQIPTVSFGVAAKLDHGWSLAANLEQKLTQERPSFAIAVTKTFK